MLYAKMGHEIIPSWMGFSNITKLWLFLNTTMRWCSSWLGPFYMGAHAFRTQECTTYLSMCD
jgi:hypothetical protein